MNKTIIFFSCLFWILQTQAQQKPTITILPDSIIIPYSGNTNLYKQTMPNAFVANSNKKAVLSGNNKQGFDIYALPIDNMPCLVPDKDNRAGLQNMMLQPGRIYKDNFDAVVRQIEDYITKKQIDSVFNARKKTKPSLSLPDLK